MAAGEGRGGGFLACLHVRGPEAVALLDVGIPEEFSAVGITPFVAFQVAVDDLFRALIGMDRGTLEDLGATGLSDCGRERERREVEARRGRERLGLALPTAFLTSILVGLSSVMSCLVIFVKTSREMLVGEIGNAAERGVEMVIVTDLSRLEDDP